MDKKYIENQYHLAVLDFQTARSEEAQWEARKTMARLEQIAAQEYGFEYADDLHEKELGGKENIVRGLEGTDNEAQGEVTERTDSRFPLRHYSQQKRVSRVNAAVIDRP